MADDTDNSGKPLRGEFLEMMQRCKAEIEDLRARIAFLEPKAAAYDDLSAVLRLLPKPSQGMGENLVWRLDRRIGELMKPAESTTEHHPV